jgi:large subunit ribosomal protein L18
MGSASVKTEARLKRKKRIRKKVFGTQQRPRLSVFRSAKHIYAQIIDDTEACTVVSASSTEKLVREQFAGTAAPSAKPADTADTPSAETADKAPKGKISLAAFVGKLLAERAIEKGITQIVFDRNGFQYHGRVKAVSDGARKAGLNF